MQSGFVILKNAPILLAKAFFSAGYYVQAFPVFGVERRGAPVEAYLRLDAKKILLRCNVYTPEHAVVQDVKLLGAVDVTAGLKPGGWILINAPGKPATLAAYSGFNLARVDATGIAIKNDLGTRTHPIINTAMIGAFAHMLEKLRKDYDGLIIGCGYARSRILNIEGEEFASDGLEFLDRLGIGEKTSYFGTTAIVGGGNTAVDVARSLARLGAAPLIVYRRRMQDMPAFEPEVAMAIEEGVRIMDHGVGCTASPPVNRPAWRGCHRGKAGQDSFISWPPVPRAGGSDQKCRLKSHDLRFKPMCSHYMK